MSTLTTAGCLESLKRSLEAAQATEHIEVPASIREQHALYLKGMNDGVQLAIDAIELELAMIRRFEAEEVTEGSNASLIGSQARNERG